MKTAARGLLMLALGGSLSGCGSPQSSENYRGVDVKQHAPDLTGQDLEGNPFDLNSLRGQVVLVSFWQANCPPCRMFQPTERELLHQFGDKGFVIVGVFRDDDAELGRQLEKYEKLTWRSLLDADGQISRRWRVAGAPTAFLVDAAGVIRYQCQGPAPVEPFERRIAHLLRQAGR